MIPGMQADAYPNPATRKDKDGTSDALWGQEPAEESSASQTAAQYSNAVWDGFHQGREELLRRSFDGFEPGREQAVAQMGELLEHAKDGDHESRSPFLRNHSKRNPAVVDTVFDKTKKLLDG